MSLETLLKPETFCHHHADELVEGKLVRALVSHDAARPDWCELAEAAARAKLPALVARYKAQLVDKLTPSFAPFCVFLRQ